MENLGMGGYGAYVWSSFALTLMVLVFCTIQGARRHQRVVRDLTRQLAARHETKVKPEQRS